MIVTAHVPLLPSEGAAAAGVENPQRAVTQLKDIALLCQWALAQFTSLGILECPKELLPSSLE